MKKSEWIIRTFCAGFIIAGTFGWLDYFRESINNHQPTHTIFLFMVWATTIGFLINNLNKVTKEKKSCKEVSTNGD